MTVRTVVYLVLAALGVAVMLANWTIMSTSVDLSLFVATVRVPIYLLLVLAAGLVLVLDALVEAQQRHRWMVERRQLLAERDQARLELAMAAGHMGVFDWDLGTGQIVWEANHAALFGLAPGEFDGTYATYAKLIHPDDLPEMERGLTASRESHSEYDAEYRVVWPDGSIHWVASRGRFWYDDDGRAMIGEMEVAPA